MKLGIALTLVFACPSVAAAQYAFQLRPSPYRVLSGWEQSANARSQLGDRDTRAATSVSDRSEVGDGSIRHQARDSDLTGGVYRTQSTH